MRAHAGAILFLTQKKRPAPVSTDPSFEGAKGLGDGWSPWVTWGVGAIRRDKKAARTGQFGILVKGLKRGAPLQTIKVTPGRYAAIAHVRVPKPVKAGATIELCMTMRDAKGRNLPTPSTIVPAAPGPWKPMALVLDVPAAVGKKPVKQVLFLIVLNGFGPDDEVYIDDMAMYRLADPDK